MSNEPNDKNQGEGNREADKVYREAATGFAKGGQVGVAAAVSRAAVNGPEGESLREAEKIGKAHTAEDDSHDAGPLPTFWGAAQQTGWERVRSALRRDWVQTKADLGMESGSDIGQSAGDTVGQAVGTRPLPGVRPGLDWDASRHAVRLGYGAASYWADDEWGEPLEDRLRVEWTSMNTGLPFETAIPLARYGWEQGRKEVEVTKKLR